MEIGMGGAMPQEEQQDLIPVGLRCDPVWPFWEFGIPSRMVSDVDSCTCIVLASRFSRYSHLVTTRFAIYSNTPTTPSPVFADVKNSFGLRSGFSDWGGEFSWSSISCGSVGSRCWDIEGKGLELVRALRRAKLLGVIVGVEEEEDEDEGLRLTRLPNVGDSGMLGGGEGEREARTGEDLADS